jgi:allophanate hydrolase subunit 2
MAQATPGMKVRFSKTLDDEAQAAFHDRLAMFNKVKEFAASKA